MIVLGCLLSGCLILSPEWAVAAEEDAVSSAPGETKTASQPPTAEELGHWIEQLDSDKFLVRENATQKLAEAERQAIPRLADAVRTGSLEKAIRCIHVLRSFAVGDDIETEIEATAKLAVIAATENDRVANYASDVIKKLEPLRQERAIRILSGLGAKFSEYSAQQGFQVPLDGPTLVIDADFQGKASDLYYLQHLKFIEDVQIERDDLSPEWLAQVAKMPSLRFMTIKHGTLSREAVRELEPVLPRLQAVRIYHLKLDPEAIPSLGNMTSLVKGDFFGLDLHEAEQAKLLAGLPEAVHPEIKFRSGGFLGVVGNNLTGKNACTIQNVHQESGAYKAGLRGNDIVTQVDGQNVDNFSHLIILLRDKEVGDKIEMEILRGGETKQISVTLGEWPMRKGYES